MPGENVAKTQHHPTYADLTQAPGISEALRREAGGRKLNGLTCLTLNFLINENIINFSYKNRLIYILTHMDCMDTCGIYGLRFCNSYMLFC